MMKGMRHCISSCIAIVLVGGSMSTSARAGECEPDTKHPTSRYVIRGSEVYDKKMDLTWARCSVGQTWKDGVGCAGMVQEMDWNRAMQLNGSGWRLPTKDELHTLVSQNCKKLRINEDVFPDMDDAKPTYWTSTAYGQFAWGVYFGGGLTATYDYLRTESNAVRLVRGGQ